MEQNAGLQIFLKLGLSGYKMDVTVQKQLSSGHRRREKQR